MTIVKPKPYTISKYLLCFISYLCGDLQRSTPFSENEETCQEPPFRPALVARAGYVENLPVMISIALD
jgi:hypothetical protein